MSPHTKQKVSIRHTERHDAHVSNRVSTPTIKHARRENVHRPTAPITVHHVSHTRKKPSSKQRIFVTTKKIKRTTHHTPTRKRHTPTIAKHHMTTVSKPTTHRTKTPTRRQQKTLSSRRQQRTKHVPTKSSHTSHIKRSTVQPPTTPHHSPTRKHHSPTKEKKLTHPTRHINERTPTKRQYITRPRHTLVKVTKAHMYTNKAVALASQLGDLYHESEEENEEHSTPPKDHLNPNNIDFNEVEEKEIKPTATPHVTLQPLKLPLVAEDSLPHVQPGIQPTHSDRPAGNQVNNLDELFSFKPDESSELEDLTINTALKTAPTELHSKMPTNATSSAATTTQLFDIPDLETTTTRVHNTEKLTEQMENLTTLKEANKTKDLMEFFDLGIDYFDPSAPMNEKATVPTLGDFSFLDQPTNTSTIILSPSKLKELDPEIPTFADLNRTESYINKTSSSVANSNSTANKNKGDIGTVYTPSKNRLENSSLTNYTITERILKVPRHNESSSNLHNSSFSRGKSNKWLDLRKTNFTARLPEEDEDIFVINITKVKKHKQLNPAKKSKVPPSPHRRKKGEITGMPILLCQTALILCGPNFV